MKVNVRVATDYSKCDKKSLIVMLRDQECELEELRSELQLMRDLHEKEIDILLDKLNQAAEDAKKWRDRAEKQEAATHTEDEKRKFYAVLTKARNEGWLSLFVPNMTEEQRAWMDDWKKEERERENNSLSEKKSAPQMRKPVRCYRVVFSGCI